MINFLVIGLCIFLLLAVIYFSIRPISMGIEARRNIKDDLNNNQNDVMESQLENKNISDEIIKLNKLKNEGLLTEEEFERAKEKLLN
tara:strand:+ start:215 stop:475 length:261 start_codon:yes stop_codon:yes gene_type:complete